MRAPPWSIVVGVVLVAGCSDGGSGNKSGDVKVRAPGVSVDVNRDKDGGGDVKVDVGKKDDR
jgi:hypothetical protein